MKWTPFSFQAGRDVSQHVHSIYIYIYILIKQDLSHQSPGDHRNIHWVEVGKTVARNLACHAGNHFFWDREATSCLLWFQVRRNRCACTIRRRSTPVFCEGLQGMRKNDLPSKYIMWKTLKKTETSKWLVKCWGRNLNHNWSWSQVTVLLGPSDYDFTLWNMDWPTAFVSLVPKAIIYFWNSHHRVTCRRLKAKVSKSWKYILIADSCQLEAKPPERIIWTRIFLQKKTVTHGIWSIHWVYPSPINRVIDPTYTDPQVARVPGRREGYHNYRWRRRLPKYPRNPQEWASNPVGRW